MMRQAEGLNHRSRGHRPRNSLPAGDYGNVRDPDCQNDRLVGTFSQHACLKARSCLTFREELTMHAVQRFISMATVGYLLLWVGPTFAAESADLKVTRVALFSSGVGFFQREATVTDSATAQLQFRTAQVNDILKSLVVQDRD